MNQLERKAAETANKELNIALGTLSDIELLLGQFEPDSSGINQLKQRAKLCYKQMTKVNDWLNAMSEKAS